MRATAMTCNVSRDSTGLFGVGQTTRCGATFNYTGHALSENKLICAANFPQRPVSFARPSTTKPFLVRNYSGGITNVAALILLLCGAFNAQGAQPTLTDIDPKVRIDLTKTSLNVKLTGSGFNQRDTAGQQPTLVFNPNVISYTPVVWSGDGTSGTTTFTLSAQAVGIVKVTVHTASFGDSAAFNWDTGVPLVTECLEAFQSNGCAIRWEVDVTGVTNTGSQQGNSNTTPNFLTTLDWRYQVGPTKAAPKAKKLKTTSTNIIMHGIFKGGYTQVPTATKVQPTNLPSTSTSPSTSASPSTATPSMSCPSSSGMSSNTTSAIPASCTAATTQQAFVVEAKGTLGLTFGLNGSGTFSELGIGVRGSLQDLVATNQVVQSGGLSYIDLSSLNPKNAVGLYEGVGRFRIASIGHDHFDPNQEKSQNVSSLLVMEAGYQYNSGLQGLASSPQTNTRNRFVGRFYLYPPELPGGTHTKLVVGMEYSGGINGGPKVIQIFFGTNLNPSKLFNPVKTSQ